MSYRYSTALSYLVLAGTGGYCWSVYDGRVINQHFPCYTFGIITCHSLLGVWKWGNPQYGNDINSMYKFTLFLQDWFALPCITSQVWLNYDYPREITYVHLAPPIYMLIMYLLHKQTDEFYEIFVTATMFSLGIVSFFNNNFYGIATAVAYAINCFVIKEDSLAGFEDVPVIDLYNYGLCFFTLFALQTSRRL